MVHEENTYYEHEQIRVDGVEEEEYEECSLGMGTMMEYNISTDQPAILSDCYIPPDDHWAASGGRDETSDKGLQWPVLCGC